MWELISGGLSAIIKPITTIIDGWQQRKTAQLTSDLKVNEAVTEAKIKRLQTQEDADIAWENTALATTGWKSGYLTIIFSLPLVLMFIPEMVPIIEHGFDAINHAPDWYKAGVGAMVAADFGIKKLVDFMQTKKGS